MKNGLFKNKYGEYRKLEFVKMLGQTATSSGHFISRCNTCNKFFNTYPDVIRYCPHCKVQFF